MQVSPPLPIQPSWRSWCARPPEERKDAVRFGGSAPRRSLIMVGPEPSKLMMPVRSRPSAPMASSSGVERLPVKEMVVGWIPTLPASFMGVSFSS